jgi:hypothetical protein
VIVVTVELWSASTRKRSRLGAMTISNDGTGCAARGNYDCVVLRKGNWTPTRTCHVNDYPRKSYPIWRLVLRALRGCFPEERAR